MTAACAGLRRLADYVAVEVTVTLMEILGPLCRIRLPTRHDAGLALLVDRNEGQRGLRDLDAFLDLAIAFGVDLHVDGERGAADAHNHDKTTKEVAGGGRPGGGGRRRRGRRRAARGAAGGGGARGGGD